MDDDKAREFAIDAIKKTAVSMGLPVDPEMIERATQLGHMVVDALGGSHYRKLHARAVAESAKIISVKDAEISRLQRLNDR